MKLLRVNISGGDQVPHCAGVTWRLQSRMWSGEQAARAAPSQANWLHCQLLALVCDGAQDTMSLEGHCSYTISIKIIFYMFHSCATQIWCWIHSKVQIYLCSSEVISMFMFLMRLKDVHNGKHLVFISTVISHVDTHDSHMILETCLGDPWAQHPDTRHPHQHHRDGSCLPSLLSVMMAAMMSRSSTWHRCYVMSTPGLRHGESVGLQFANLRQARVPHGAVICGNKLLHIRLASNPFFIYWSLDRYE